LRYRWPGASRDIVGLGELRLAAGERLFVRGASGSGKSTLLSLVAGVLVASAGRVEVLGTDWATLSPSRRDRHRADHVGYVFQQFNLLPYLSVMDNVLLPCRFSPRRAQRAGDPVRAAQRLLERAGLPADHWHRPAAELSVGQQQRVAAARALLGDPELVIADEPTSALDEELRDAFMALLLDSCERANSALLFVSHDPRLAARFERSLELGSTSPGASDA
jgi:putative ABC transport system ATP-binding protein